MSVLSQKMWLSVVGLKRQTSARGQIEAKLVAVEDELKTIAQDVAMISIDRVTRSPVTVTASGFQQQQVSI